MGQTQPLATCHTFNRTLKIFVEIKKTAAELLQTPYYVQTTQSAAENGIYKKKKKIIRYRSRLYFSEIIAWGQSVAVLSQREATIDLD